ncbi:DUF1656 domain-containing protein [Amantichitinum ursilacus]|uniref:Efflux system membrane protein n=1 Tax=Amantichitinum ursilacus TaxID=857265 RepID=A0A0N0GQG0_9NEIS|nr:DUF1656 domain-containing protein [Amantichitinum ursilacus]KPC54752.1 efflux system membrane protein [Amantichitinum ursilacus]
MNAELDIYGVFLPGLLGMMIIAWLVLVVVKWVLEKTGFYKLVWHRSLFNLALYVIALGGTFSLLHGLQS